MKKIAKDDACFFTQQPFLIGTYDPEGAPRFATISWISYTFGPPACLVAVSYTHLSGSGHGILGFLVVDLIWSVVYYKNKTMPCGRVGSMIFTVLGMNGPYAAAGGAGSGYLLRDDEMKENILLDCGPGVVARLQKYTGLRSLSGVVLSHLHYDHMSDMLALQYALGNWENPLRVVAPEEPKPVWTLLNAPCFQLQARCV